MRINRMHYLLSIYSIINLYMFRAGLLLIIQQVLLCMYSDWYMSCFYVD